MKIELKNNLPKYISAVICIISYIMVLSKSDLMYSSSSKYIFGVIFSIMFLLSFYVMTCFFATSKVFCAVFSVFFLIILGLHISFLFDWEPPAWYALMSFAIHFWFLTPILPLSQFIVKCAYAIGIDNVDLTDTYYVLLYAVCILFYIICFATRFLKKRKEQNCEKN